MYQKRAKIGVSWPKNLCMLQLWLPDRCICKYFFCLKCKSFRDESGWDIWDLLVGGSSLISSESSPPCQSTRHTIDSFISPQKIYTIPFNKAIQLTFHYCLKYRVELGLNIAYSNKNIPRKLYHLTCRNKTVWTFCLWRPSYRWKCIRWIFIRNGRLIDGNRGKSGMERAVPCQHLVLAIVKYLKNIGTLPNCLLLGSSLERPRAHLPRFLWFFTLFNL